MDGRKVLGKEMNIIRAQKNCEGRNHFVFLPEKELKTVPEKYPSGIYPEFVSLKT